jgi:hypothetical protein
VALNHNGFSWQSVLLAFGFYGAVMRRVVLASIVSLAAANVCADVGALVGVTYAFGSSGGVGLTLQATSTRHEDRAVAAAGLGYYPFATGSKFGIPVGIGYQGRNAAGIAGYDLLLGTPFVSGGYVNTRGDSSESPPSAAAPAAPSTPFPF